MVLEIIDQKEMQLLDELSEADKLIEADKEVESKLNKGLTIEDYGYLKEIMFERKAPIKFEVNGEKFAIVYRKEAVPVFQKKGFRTITLDDLFEKCVIDPETYEELPYEEQKNRISMIKNLLIQFEASVTK